MVNKYKSIRDENGDVVNSRTKLFVIKTDDEGGLIEYLSGKYITPENDGRLYIVDDYIEDQMHKLMVKDGELMVKDGETIDEPVKSELEIKEEELLKQLEELQKQKAADQ